MEKANYRKSDKHCSLRWKDAFTTGKTEEYFQIRDDWTVRGMVTFRRLTRTIAFDRSTAVSMTPVMAMTQIRLISFAEALPQPYSGSPSILVDELDADRL